MKCRDVQRMSTDYLEGELDERRASALRGHLRVCDECHAAIADEAALRDAAEALEPAEPPPELWSRVQRSLAEAEISDSRRGSMWLLLPRLRQAALPAAVVVAAVVALLLWTRRDEPRTAAPSPRPPAVAKSDSGAGHADEPEASFLGELASEIDHTDRDYRATIRELRSVAKSERAGWSPATAARFDAEIRRFEVSARDHLQKLAVATEAPDPRSRDELYTLYQSHIRFLQRAAVGELQ